MSPIPSPCIDVCRMDDSTGLCAGCFRTLEEITRWAAASNQEKRAILAAVAQRRAFLPSLQKSPLRPPFSKGGTGGFLGGKS